MLFILIVSKMSKHLVGTFNQISPLLRNLREPLFAALVLCCVAAIKRTNNLYVDSGSGGWREGSVSRV